MVEKSHQSADTVSGSVTANKPTDTKDLTESKAATHNPMDLTESIPAEPTSAESSASEPKPNEPGSKEPEPIEARLIKPRPIEPRPLEHGGPKGLEPTRYGDWEKNGRCTDF